MGNKSQKFPMKGIQVKNIKNQNFLEEIVRIKKEELSHKSLKIQKTGLSGNRNFKSSENLRFSKLFQKEEEGIKLIAEAKFASPTNTNLGSSEDLLRRVKMYEEAGVDAVSIITEKHFFKGDIAFISQVKKEISLPVLQKDFIIDSVQIYEAKEAGSDALLLIARLVAVEKLQEFVSLCFSFGIEPVVEINNEEDLKKAVATQTNIIAVNARNLETLVVDVVGACMLVEKIPDNFAKLGFSGITSQREVLLYKESGVNGILVGTSLMKTKNIKQFISDLQI